MRIDRVIIRAALSTLAAIAVLVVVMIASLSIAFPHTMMHFTYDLGLDGLSVQYANRAYRSSGRAYYAAYAFEVAIGADDYENVETCGLTLVADDEFEEYCAVRSETLTVGTYKDYVYGKICVAKYRQDKKDDAVSAAWAYIDEGTSFVNNNAMAALLIEVLGAKDIDTVNTVLGKLNEIDQSELSTGEVGYLTDLISATENWTDNNA